MPYQDHSDALIGEVADSLRSLPRMFVDLVLPRLPDLDARLAAGARVLDLGCGAGWAIVELAQRYPTSRVDGGDIEPRSIELAQERIVQHGLTERCSARLLGPEGLTDDGRYDVITMFLVVHEILPELKDRVLASAARALAPGGSLVIFDEALPRNRCRPAHDAKPLLGGRAVVRADLGQPDRHGRRTAGSVRAGRASIWWTRRPSAGSRSLSPRSQLDACSEPRPRRLCRPTEAGRYPSLR